MLLTIIISLMITRARLKARKPSKNLLRQVEIRFQNLAAVLPVGIYQNDAEGNCIYVNEKCCELCGLDRSKLLGKNWMKNLYPEDRHRVVIQWNNAVRRKIPFHAEYRFNRLNGATVWVLGQAVPEFDESGTFKGFIGSITDITERKRLETEILSISIQEQQRIGQALHDRLGQHLTGIAFLAKALAQKLVAAKSESARDAEEIAGLINQAILRARDLTRMLHPVELEENGLNAAFQDLVSNAAKMFDISCTFDCDHPVPVHDNALATHLYHIAQEAITNAVKHGAATRVSVSLGNMNGRTCLKVEDNGKGIRPGYQDSKGLGLRIMRHRAARIDGDFTIGPGEKGGTLMMCFFEAPETAGDDV